MFIRLSMQSLIDTIGNNPEKYFQIWKQIKTEEELFMCNIEFIKGRIYGTPSHDGPLNFDSVLLMNDLIELHNYKFFSTEGQGPLLEYDKWCDETWKHVCTGKQCGKWYYSIEQKPYLNGFIETKHIEQLIEYIEKFNNNTTDKMFYVINTSDYTKTNFYSQHNVTRQKSYKEIKLKEESDWDYFTNIWADQSYGDSMSLFDSNYSNIASLLENKYAYISVAMEKYGSNVSIEKILLHFLKLCI